MKRSKLHMALAMATAIGGSSLGLFAPSAGAVNLSGQSPGEALIFPYFTSRDNWNTLLSVTNTENTTLAVRFRFHEGYNSRDVLDFTVLLSPYDVFAGTVSADTAGMTRFTPASGASGDKTCFVVGPAPVTGPLPFRTSGFIGGNADGGPGTGLSATDPVTIDRLREGYVEVFVMGHAAADTPIARAAKHRPLTATTRPGEPEDCAYVINSFRRANILGTARQFGEPVNALTGSYSLVNAPRGVSAGGNATALANFVDIPTRDTATGLSIPAPARPTCGGGDLVNGGRVATPAGTGLMFLSSTPSNRAVSARNLGENGWDPINQTADCPNLISAQEPNDFLEPSLADAYPNVVFQYNSGSPLDSAPINTDAARDFGNVVGPTGYGYGFVAVTEAFRATGLVNQWANANTPLGAVTEWVIMHPTKSFYVDNRNGSSSSALSYQRFPAGFNYANGNTMPIAPFAQLFAAPGQSCVDVGLNLWDRDEQGTVPDPDASPGDPNPLCYEANVVQFEADPNRSIFKSKLKLDLSDYVQDAVNNRQIAASPQNGWMRMDLTYSPTARLATSRQNNPLWGDGLPALGFMITERIFGNARLNYAHIVDHNYQGRGVVTREDD